jgi:hypothetical protein
MSARTKTTLKMICVREAIVNQELPEEAQRLLDAYNDPDVSPEQKKIAKAELDKAIEALEAKVTTRRLNEIKA